MDITMRRLSATLDAGVGVGQENCFGSRCNRDFIDTEHGWGIAPRFAFLASFA